MLELLQKGDICYQNPGKAGDMSLSSMSNVPSFAYMGYRLKIPDELRKDSGLLLKFVEKCLQSDPGTRKESFEKYFVPYKILDPESEKKNVTIFMQHHNWRSIPSFDDEVCIIKTSNRNWEIFE